MTTNGSVLEPSTLPPPLGPVSDIRSLRRAAPGDYRSLFPGLAPLVVEDERLVALAAALTEDSDTADGDNHAIPAGYTYLGQFIAHDLTHDQTSHRPQAHAGANGAVPRNVRTPALDLDCLYGHGPFWDAPCYSRDGTGRFRIGATVSVPDHHDRQLPSSKDDLPRDKQGFATIPDQRNDGHLVLAQLHVAFMKAHNRLLDGFLPKNAKPADAYQRLLDKYGVPFAAARSSLTSHYRSVVLGEFAEALLDEAVYARLKAHGPQLFEFSEADPYLPSEFSCAAFRLHTMVRAVYDFNAIFPDSRLKQLLDFTGPYGGGTLTPIAASWVIDWRRFFPLDPAVKPNASRKLDGRLTRVLNRGERSLPGLDVGLSERTLLRGSKMGLPSGQDVARALKLRPLGTAELGTGADGAVAAQLGLLEATPLWYYIMKEAAYDGHGRGQKLGPVGSTIVGEVLFGLAGNDPLGPAEPRLIPPGMQGLITFAGAINPSGV